MKYNFWIDVLSPLVRAAGEILIGLWLFTNWHETPTWLRWFVVGSFIIVGIGSVLDARKGYLRKS